MSGQAGILTPGPGQDGQNLDALLDATAAGRYLGLEGVVKHPAQAVRSLARKRRLRCTRIAGKLFFRVSWLEEYVTDNTREPAVQDG